MVESLEDSAGKHSPLCVVNFVSRFESSDTGAGIPQEKVEADSLQFEGLQLVLFLMSYRMFCGSCPPTYAYESMNFITRL